MTAGVRVGGTVLGAGVSLFLAPAASGIPAITRRLPACGSGNELRPLVSLTFDDGPHPCGTPAILDLLGENRLSATFFVVGEQLRRFPDMGSRIVAEGHRIEVHGWTHRCILTVSPSQTREQLTRTAELVETVAGVRPTRYRPPYGVMSLPALAACRAVGLRPTWWTAWGRDWDRGATAQSVHHRVARHIGPGRSATVLLHDSDTYGTRGSWRTTTAALALLIDTCAARGVAIGRPQT